MTPDRPCRLASQAGFTLIEMIVVLAILALVGSLVMARGPQRSAALDMRTATGTVAQTLRVARTRAIAANRAVAVRFDTRNATLQLGADRSRSLPVGIGMAVTTAADAGVAIAFLPDGSSTGGRVRLAGNGRQAEVGVDWLTGRVSVADAP